MSGHPPPLRKQKPDGSLYSRPAKVELQLRTTLDWPFEEFLRCGRVMDLRHAEYIASEVVFHHLRMTRHDPHDHRFNALFPIVEARFLRGFPSSHTFDGGQKMDDDELQRMRADQLDEFVKLIVQDRQGYEERLDFYEVRFEKAAKMRRIDGFRAYYRRKERIDVSDVHDEDAHSSEVEAALAELQAQIQAPDETLAFRFELRRAIGLLPDSERQVIDMWMADIPMESNDPDVETISQLLNCTPKTVRNRRDRAVLRLRETLGIGETR